MDCVKVEDTTGGGGGATSGEGVGVGVVVVVTVVVVFDVVSLVSVVELLGPHEVTRTARLKQASVFI